MNKKTLFFILVCVLLTIQSAFTQEDFTWHLAVVKNDLGMQFDPLVPISMQNGESFHVEIYTERDCYAYIIVEQPSGSMLTLISQQVRSGSTQKTGNLRLNPPSGDIKFHVITSLQEQKDLQNAINGYKTTQNAVNTQKLREALSDIRDPNEGDGGKPVDFGGSIRGGPEVQGRAFSGGSTYVKNIVISH